jgi:hypothetical protein
LRMNRLPPRRENPSVVKKPQFVALHINALLHKK